MTEIPRLDQGMIKRLEEGKGVWVLRRRERLLGVEEVCGVLVKLPPLHTPRHVSRSGLCSLIQKVECGLAVTVDDRPMEGAPAGSETNKANQIKFLERGIDRAAALSEEESNKSD